MFVTARFRPPLSNRGGRIFRNNPPYSIGVGGFFGIKKAASFSEKREGGGFRSCSLHLATGTYCVLKIWSTPILRGRWEGLSLRAMRGIEPLAGLIPLGFWKILLPRTTSPLRQFNPRSDNSIPAP